VSYVCKKVRDMPVKKKLEDKITYRIKRSSYSTFVLSDFFDLSDRDQILRALVDSEVSIS
jgi:hypothetical protein